MPSKTRSWRTPSITRWWKCCRRSPSPASSGLAAAGRCATSVTLGVLVAFIQYAQRFFRPIQDLSEKYNILQSAMASSERIFKLLDTPAEIVSPAHAQSPGRPGRIEFDHVWFAYRTWRRPRKKPPARGEKLKLGRPRGEAEPTEEFDWVLRDVSFTIDPGTDGSVRRPHRRGQDHYHLTAAALLRRAAGRYPHRRRRYSRYGISPTFAAASALCCKIRSCFPAPWRQHSPGLALDSGRSGRRSRRTGECRRLYSLAARRL